LVRGVTGRVDYLSDVCENSFRHLARKELPVTADEDALRNPEVRFKEHGVGDSNQYRSRFANLPADCVLAHPFRSKSDVDSVLWGCKSVVRLNTQLDRNVIPQDSIRINSAVQMRAKDHEWYTEQSRYRTQLANREDGVIPRDELIPEALVAMRIMIWRLLEWFVGMRSVPVRLGEDFDGPSVVGRNASADRLMRRPVTGLAFFGLEA
jgi:hypothetical protein